MRRNKMFSTDSRKFIKTLNENKIIFEDLLQQISREENDAKKIQLALKTIKFADNSSTGYFSSDIVEQVFIDYAQRLKVELPQNYEKNSVLHVMTEAYKTGGHTRVVERWIKLAPQKQSVLFTENEKQTPPSLLAEVVEEKNGSFYYLQDAQSIEEKAIELRKIASQYELIVLHIHMHDIIPLVAFGTTDFKRPVLLFNHADHRFWVGGSIADEIINFRSWGKNLCEKKRGFSNNVVLSLPIDTKGEKHFDAWVQKQKMNLPQDKKIIISVGSPHKYKPMPKFNFFEKIKTILCKFPDAYVLIIGPQEKDFSSYFKEYKSFQKKTNRIKAIGRVNPQELFEYLGCADLVLDSFPMSGGTALVDAISCNRPVLSLSCPTEQLDYIMDSVAYCKDEQIYMQKIENILKSIDVANENVFNVKQEIEKYSSPEIWLKNWGKIYENALLNPHQIYHFNSFAEDEFNDLDWYLYFHTLRERRKLYIPYIFSYSRIHQNGKKFNKMSFFDKFSFYF